jgi:hypothetical protein
MTTHQSCFVISPIGEPNSEERRHADQLFNHIISPVMHELGIESERADHIHVPGSIPEQILAKLIEADIVIADLSKANPNVYYELAIRHVTRKPCIHLIDTQERPSFDVGHLRTIFFNLADPDAVVEAKSSLKRYAANLDPSNPPLFPRQFSDKLEDLFVTQGWRNLESNQGFARFSFTFPKDVQKSNQFIPNTSGFRLFSNESYDLLAVKLQLETWTTLVQLAIDCKDTADKDT